MQWFLDIKREIKQIQTLLVTFSTSQLPVKKLSKLKFFILFFIIPNKQSNNNA